MIEWKTNNYEDETLLVATLDATDWPSLGIQYTDAIKVFASEAAKLPPKCWNRIYFDLWTDSGRVIVFTHKRGKPLSTRLLTVQLCSPFVADQYAELPDAKSGVPLWRTYGGALDGKVWMAMHCAIDDVEVINSMQALGENTDYTSWEMRYGNIEKIVPIYFVE